MLASASDVFAASVWDIWEDQLGHIPSGTSGTTVEIDVNTGGNSANGGTVRTGDASANVEVRTNGPAGTATSSVNVTTTVNGVASSSHYTSLAGVPVEVRVTASSTGSAESVVEQIASSTERVRSASTSTGNISTDAAPRTIRERMRASLAKITHYVEQLFSRFWN